MSDPTKEVKLVTISWDEDAGLEVDYTGCSPYEAWAFLVHATELLDLTIGGGVFECDDDE